jgi:hypothetical protein
VSALYSHSSDPSTLLTGADFDWLLADPAPKKRRYEPTVTNSKYETKSVTISESGVNCVEELQDQVATLGQRIIDAHYTKPVFPRHGLTLRSQFKDPAYRAARAAHLCYMPKTVGQLQSWVREDRRTWCQQDSSLMQFSTETWHYLARDVFNYMKKTRPYPFKVQSIIYTQDIKIEQDFYHSAPDRWCGKLTVGTGDYAWSVIVEGKQKLMKLFYSGVIPHKIRLRYNQETDTHFAELSYDRHDTESDYEPINYIVELFERTGSDQLTVTILAHLAKHGATMSAKLRKGERLRDKIEAQLAKLKTLPRLIRSFFKAPSVAYITDC